MGQVNKHTFNKHNSFGVELSSETTYITPLDIILIMLSFD